MNEKNILPTLSIIVPVYNEERELPSVLSYLFSLNFDYSVEWIFVEDCSTDKSLEILQNEQNQYGYRIIAQPKNQGKGAAVIRGIKEARGEILIIQDADFEYDVFDVPKLIKPILDGRADVVYGSRFKKNAPQVHRTYHYFINRFLTMLSNLSSGIYLTDMETCYKAFRTELVQNMNLKSYRFGIEVEFTAYIAKTPARVQEHPISYFPRTQLQGKKINWKDGVAALIHIFRFNFLISFGEAFKDTLPERFNPALRKNGQLMFKPSRMN